jgi:putative membrane-bound dehydrogenase-like protein
VELNGHRFTLPLGFEIEIAAPSARVPRPITADFDEQGRLYVADSSGTNEDVEQQIKHPSHRIVRLEDIQGNGQFDKATVFADHVMFPEGTMWRAGSLYVAAPPSIWKFTDKTGRGVANERVEWFEGKTLTHCANDLHGPYLGPDGWIYWCKGAFARQVYDRPGKQPFITKAAHIFRARPDGSGIEPVMTGGMDNPVAVVFMPNGERIFTTTFFQHPAGGLRDGLIHAVYGAIYGKVHEVIFDHPWTGPTVMPVLTHMGAAAPCGLVRYETTAFGPEYANNLFACQFNMHKVSRHVLTPNAATYSSRDDDFLVSDNHDFHPTDVLEDADGSLLVVDTGGWYKICCPTSQLQKPDVLGAIYRIRRPEAPRVDDPRGLKIAWVSLDVAALAERLDDSRPAVRRKAIELLADKARLAISALRRSLNANSRSPEARRNAIWTLARIDQDDARSAVRAALADPDADVRQAALNVVSIWRDRAALGDLLRVLESGTAMNRRVAAEALGRIGDRSAVGPLLRAAEQPADRFLHHALTYALMEIGDRASVEQLGLASENPRVLRSALVALDQMPGGKLAADAVVSRLSTNDFELKETLLWIAGRHPDWGEKLAGYFRGELDRMASKPAAAHEELKLLLARLSGSSAIQSLVGERLTDKDAPAATNNLLLGVVERSGLQQLPEAWVAALVGLLEHGSPESLPRTIDTVRHAVSSRGRLEPLAGALLKLASNKSLANSIRLAALAAIPGASNEISPELIEFARRFLGREPPATERSAALDAIARAKLTREQLLSLSAAIGQLAPLEVDRLLEAFQQSRDEAVGLALVGELGRYEMLTSLRIDMIKPRLAKYPTTVQKAAEALYLRIDADLAGQAEKLERILHELPAGDVRRGQAVFQSAKVSCTSCHAIGYLGGRVGPDLTLIAKIRTKRDLVESIVFPSASIVRSYEPVMIETRSGMVYNGLIKQETADQVELVTGPERMVRITKSDIEETRPSKISVMPAGMDQILTRQELADLVEFLQTCK